MKTQVQNFLRKKGKQLITFLILIVLAVVSWSSSGMGSYQEYVLFNEAVDLKEEFEEKVFTAQTSQDAEPPSLEELIQVLDRFKTIVGAHSLDSEVDAWSQFNIGTILVEYQEYFLRPDVKRSQIYLVARNFLIEALRDHYNEDFVRQLEKVNESTKQALQQEGHSLEEAEEILREDDLPPQEGEEGENNKGGGLGGFEWDF